MESDVIIRGITSDNIKITAASSKNTVERARVIHGLTPVTAAATVAPAGSVGSSEQAPRTHRADRPLGGTS